jgi:hypothetical protein
VKNFESGGVSVVRGEPLSHVKSANENGAGLGGRVCAAADAKTGAIATSAQVIRIRMT